MAPLDVSPPLPPTGPVLGVFDGTHDAGAALVVDGRLVAAASEERFSRRKGAGGWPDGAIRGCLAVAGLDPRDLGAVAFAGLVNPNPGLRAVRRLQRRWQLDDRDAWNPTGLRGRAAEAIQLHSPFPRMQSDGRVARAAAPALKALLDRQLRHALPGFRGPVHLFDHHRCHAAAAWLTAGAVEGLVVVADGVGDGLALTVWRGRGVALERLAAWPFPHSHGLLYATVTALLGFRPFRHEGKLAGLAAHGDPDRVPLAFPFRGGPLERRLEPGLGASLRAHLAPLQGCAREDVCAWLQRGLEQDMTALIGGWMQQTGLTQVSVAGGVFANVRLNQRVAALPGLRSLWVFPHMGDGGLAAGSALLVDPPTTPTRLPHVYLGPGTDPGAVQRAIQAVGFPVDRPPDLAAAVARHLGRGDAVAVATGCSEFGPRALGHRSILASARDPAVSERLNRALSRSDFMPFAPALLAEEAEASVEGLDRIHHSARFMTACVQARPALVGACPAVVHRDGSLRPQVVHADTGGLLHRILQAHHRATGEPAVLNTSFNLHEEPIVQTPDEAMRTFARSGLEALVLGDQLVLRPGVPSTTGHGSPHG